ncbi:hypothetical protein SAMN05421636_10996 [Pricia antarctica]|uniref:Phenylalanyl-tRNA synthetase subunit alpha n=1 Tax=Pricia antarctica TaxID=641691 RepID=A0A1G7HBC7_9FLAO|nr:hypothetical protein [Pricia antarctica]SDE97708.1 hypothetical protein SAMN05421636_10996 [Pricia antarctica]
MKKDIEIPIAKDVHVALIHECNDEFLSKDWNAYLINGRNAAIDMVLVVSKGFDRDRKTSTMRHGMGSIGPKSFKKIELVPEDVLALNNEFFVTFFADDKLYEKRFVFPKNSVKQSTIKSIPVIEKDGILPK